SGGCGAAHPNRNSSCLLATYSFACVPTGCTVRLSVGDRQYCRYFLRESGGYTIRIRPTHPAAERTGGVRAGAAVPAVGVVCTTPGRTRTTPTDRVSPNNDARRLPPVQSLMSNAMSWISRS